jgi:hypothetical protein
MTTPTTYNPAAVLGTALAIVEVKTPAMTTGKGISMTARRNGTRSSKFGGHAYVADYALAQQLEAMPFARDSYGNNLVLTRGNTGYFNSAEYNHLLDAAALMCNAGAQAEDVLLREQLESKLRGSVQVHDRMAYEEFEIRATSALKAVLALGLDKLTGTKPPKAVESTRRSITVRNGQRGIYLYPDPYDSRFVIGDIFKPSRDEYRQVRNTLCDELERYGLRLDLNNIG